MLENETNGHANGNLNGYTNGHAGSIVEDASSATAPLLNNVSSMAEKVNSEKPVNFNGSIHRMRQMAPAKIRKRKDEGGVRQMCAWIVEHQIGLSLNILALIHLTHAMFPRARPHTRKFFQLSYYNPESGDYTVGWDDACMVAYWIVLFTALRASVMDYILTPFAAWGGVQKKKDLVRFAEQAWLLVYYFFFFPLGMYAMYYSDYWLDMKMLWRNWPDREIPAVRKWYILVQFAFWIQQILVVNIEERRKDYAQMFTHHIVTCTLIFTSYGYHQTKVGNVILVLMDVVDIFLPIAKCLKYLGFGKICDVVFGLFMAVWVVARHILYIAVCYSIYKDIPIEIDYGCYRGKKGELVGPFEPTSWSDYLEPFQDPEGTVCFTNSIKWGFLSCLLFLQVLTLMWFVMICRVAVKVLKGGKADDTRSDDEEDEEEEIEEIQTNGQMHGMEYAPIEEEVGAEALGLKGRTASTKRYKKSSSSSGVSLPGHSDRKELLGRIGCDKGV